MLARTASAALLLSLAACGEDPKLSGTVVDLWDKPMAGLDVTIPETPSVKTNDKGAYSFPVKAGKYKIKVTGDKVIPNAREVAIEANVDTPNVKLRVIPVPEKPGFNIVGPESYLQVAPQAVERKGNDLKHWQGVKSVGDLEVDGKELRVVFNTPLKMDQVARLGIELHKLTFQEMTKVATVDGDQDISLNLWTDGGKVEWTKEELGSDDNYVYRATDLPSGSYAIVSMNLLSTLEAEAFDKIPASVRRIHTFTVK